MPIEYPIYVCLPGLGFAKRVGVPHWWHMLSCPLIQGSARTAVFFAEIWQAENTRNFLVQLDFGLNCKEFNRYGLHRYF